MPHNFWWVFSAYSIVWLAILVYLGRLSGRQKTCERQLDALTRERESN
jgi:CcmD family protein